MAIDNVAGENARLTSQRQQYIRQSASLILQNILQTAFCETHGGNGVHTFGNNYNEYEVLRV